MCQEQTGCVIRRIEVNLIVESSILNVYQNNLTLILFTWYFKTIRPNS